MFCHVFLYMGQILEEQDMAQHVDLVRTDGLVGHVGSDVIQIGLGRCQSRNACSGIGDLGSGGKGDDPGPHVHTP